MDVPIDNNTRKSFIKKQPLFAQLTDDETEELASLLSEKYCKTGDKIVIEGDHVDSFFIIVEGEADVQVATVKEGKVHMQSVAILKSGNAIGINDRGFYSVTGLRTATVIAITDMTLLQMTTAAFHGFSLSHSHVSEIMHKNAAEVWDVK